MALTPRQRAYLLEGPGPNESRHDVLRAFDGPCALIVAWRRVRTEFMAACPPGRRPYGYLARGAPAKASSRQARPASCERSEISSSIVMTPSANTSIGVSPRSPRRCTPAGTSAAWPKTIGLR